MSTQAKIEFPLKIRVGSVVVTIYETPTRGHASYTIVYHEGARRNRRLFADLNRAKAEAKLVATRLNAGRGESLELSGTDRDAYLDAKALLKPLNIGLFPAVEEYAAAKKWDVPLAVAAKAYHESHNTKLPDRTVSEVCDEFLAAKKNDGISAAYLHLLEILLGKFSRDFVFKIAEVTTADLNTWLRRLKVAPRTRNNQRNAIVTVFNFAKSLGYLDREKMTAAEHTASARNQVNAIEVFTPSEFSSLLNAAGESLLPFFVFGGFCGMRTEEIKRLLWEDIRWPESSIIIRAAVSKTRTRRLAPLTDPAAAWLSKFQRSKGPVIALERLHRKVDALCVTIGVPWKNNGLRHSFITYRLAMVKDFTRVAFEAGNSPQIIRSNYDAVATEAEGKKWFSIVPDAAANVIRMVKTA